MGRRSKGDRVPVLLRFDPAKLAEIADADISGDRQTKIFELIERGLAAKPITPTCEGFTGPPALLDEGD